MADQKQLCNQKDLFAIPAVVINRLPRYYRFLTELLKEGRERVSSNELAEMMDITASKMRQDLSFFGGFGQQGYGYNVAFLRQKIGEILGIENGYKAVIVGAGNLGRALVSSHMFERRGVTRVAMFDVSSELIGKKVAGIPIYSYDDLLPFCRKNHIKIGVVTVPKDAALEVVKKMCEAGISGIWNFSNMEISVEDPNVYIENTHIGDDLLHLCFELNKRKAGDKI